MTKKMLKFVDIGQQNPPKRDKSLRKADFGEIYQEFIHEKAKEQSSRCSQCGAVSYTHLTLPTILLV